jgi:hypothetical protein
MKTIQIKYWLGFVLFMVSFNLVSCDKEPVGPTGPDPVAPGTYLPIAQFRAIHTGTDITVPVGTKRILGKVISHSANEAVGNFRLQDESGAGIYLYTLQGSPVYNLGDVLEIDAAGAGVLTLFNGDLELKNVPIAKVNIIQGATLNVTPRNATAQKVIDSLQKWASTLVTLNNVTIAKQGGANSTGQNYTVTDATGTLVSFVRTTSGIVLPEGGADAITGYISIYQPGTAPVAQLTVRTSADVVNGGQGGGPGTGVINLTTSPLTINFDNIGTALPSGVTVVTGASASSAGTAGSFTNTATTSLWNKTAAGFKNFASATGLTMGSDSAAQVNHTNRALGVRQTSSTGYDPGAAFVFTINNTTGKNNLKMDFLLQSLDTSTAVTRITTWSVDYALGDNPTSFTPATATGTMTTGNKIFSSNPVSVTFPAAVNNQAQKVWIRVVALTPTTGSNNRPSTAIDDVKFTWN